MARKGRERKGKGSEGRAGGVYEGRYEIAGWGRWMVGSKIEQEGVK